MKSHPTRHRIVAILSLTLCLAPLTGCFRSTGSATPTPEGTPIPIPTPTSAPQLSQNSREMLQDLERILIDFEEGVDQDIIDLDLDAIASQAPEPVDPSPLLTTAVSIEKDLSEPIPTLEP